MLSVSFLVFAVLDFTQKKQLPFFDLGITPVNKVKLSWNPDSCHLEHLEKLQFLQRPMFTDKPKVWIFGPTLTPTYPQKMAETKKSKYFSMEKK